MNHLNYYYYLIPYFFNIPAIKNQFFASIREYHIPKKVSKK